MDKKDFLKQYQSKEWYEISKRIKARDHNTCQMCGCNDKPVSVHHLHYGENGSIFDVEDDALITLCEDCHKKQRDFREDALNSLEMLRCNFTDFEISAILHFLSDKIQKSGTIIDHTTRPLEDILPKMSHSVPPNDIEKMVRLSKWRESVRREIYMKDAIRFYSQCGEGSEFAKKIEDWWRREFCSDIKDYILNDEG